MNMNSINGDPYVGQLREVPAETGLLMMWPASVMHNVYPNMSTEKRITISFNIILEYDNRYLE